MKKATPPASKTPSKGGAPAKCKTKLTYFDVRGRAEPCRLMLVASGTNFDDVRVSQDDWPKVKPTMPNGQMPVLEEDGRIVYQSMAITRHLAREYGFYGKNLAENSEVDMVMESIVDMRSNMFATAFGGDDEQKANALKDFKEKHIPKFFADMEKLASKNKSGFLVGSTVTAADFLVYDMIDSIILQTKESVDKFPALKANRKKVAELPKVKEYLAKRKETPF